MAAAEAVLALLLRVGAHQIEELRSPATDADAGGGGGGGREAEDLLVHELRRVHRGGGRRRRRPGISPELLRRRLAEGSKVNEVLDCLVRKEIKVGLQIKNKIK